MQEVAHWFDATLSDEISNLIWFLQAARGGVGDRPACFLLCLEVGILEDVQEGWYDVAKRHHKLKVHGLETTTYASMIAEICIGLPAVMFEMVQHASFRMPSLGDESKLRRAGRAPEEMIT